MSASCTADLIQDDPGDLAGTLGLSCPFSDLDLPSDCRTENFGADAPFLQMARLLTKLLPKNPTPYLAPFSVPPPLAFAAVMTWPKSPNFSPGWAST